MEASHQLPRRLAWDGSHRTVSFARLVHNSGDALRPTALSNILCAEMSLAQKLNSLMIRPQAKAMNAKHNPLASAFQG